MRLSGYLWENLGFKYALIGCGVAVLCLIIPLVHFVTGPLSPLIGGWVAGSSAKATPLRAVWIGTLMAVTFAGALVIVVPLAVALLPGLNFPNLSAGGTALYIVIGIAALVVALAPAGAVIGGSMARKKSGL